MMKLRSKRFSRSNSSKISRSGSGVGEAGKGGGGGGGEIKWEVRPGGMLVQKRENDGERGGGDGFIIVRVSTVSQWHDINIQPTSTFGELKKILSLVTSLEPGEQRLLYKGKEREDGEYLHMVGVRDKDKVLMLEDPAIRERKLLGLMTRGRDNGSPYRTISV